MPKLDFTSSDYDYESEDDDIQIIEPPKPAALPINYAPPLGVLGSKYRSPTPVVRSPTPVTDSEQGEPGGGYEIRSSPKIQSPDASLPKLRWKYGDRAFVVLVPKVVDRESYVYCEPEPDNGAPKEVLNKDATEELRYTVRFENGAIRTINEHELLAYENGMSLILGHRGQKAGSANGDTVPLEDYGRPGGGDIEMKEKRPRGRPVKRKRNKLDQTGSDSKLTPGPAALLPTEPAENGVSSSAPRKRGRPRKVMGLEIESQVSGSKLDEDSDNGRRRPKRSRTSVNYSLDKKLGTPSKEKISSQKPVKKWKQYKFVDYSRGAFGEFDAFLRFHQDGCFACGRIVDARLGKLAYCQGCSKAYHPKCLREDCNVFSIGGSHYLQCSHCLSVGEPNAPRYDTCTYCREGSPACEIYRNDAVGLPNPTPSWLNSPSVFFRCINCERAFHYYHLPPLDPDDESWIDLNDEELSARRLEEFTKGRHRWHCFDCAQFKDAALRVQQIMAWKPAEDSKYAQETSISQVPEDYRLYGVKYFYTSYRNMEWRPGNWIYSKNVLPEEVRKEFISRNEPPTSELEDCIPPEYLQVDIILDAKTKMGPFTAVNFEDAMSKMSSVTRVYVKNRGLDFNDLFWEVPPAQSDPSYAVYKIAFIKYIQSLFTYPPIDAHLKVAAARAPATQNLNKPIEITAQPRSIINIQLKEFQLKGSSWLYRNFLADCSCVLADEFGLGKSLQLLTFFGHLIERVGVWPFLIVTSENMVAEWRKIVETFSPSLLAVAYSGSLENRVAIREHALFHPDRRLKCHMVITDYSTIATFSDNTLHSIKWQCIALDEGHTVIYEYKRVAQQLELLHSTFRVVITGVPPPKSVSRLHPLIKYLEGKSAVDRDSTRPDFAKFIEASLAVFQNIRTLRRKKDEVTESLKPVKTFMIPVSMSTLQKEQYRGVIKQHAEVLNGLLDNQPVRSKELINDVLKLIRRVLGHPYVYDDGAQQGATDFDAALEAFLKDGPKFRLLSMILPKLHDLGQKVLLFSQQTAMLDCIGTVLESLNLDYVRVDANTPPLDQRALIDEFNRPDSGIFAYISTTRDGGVGVSLTAATTVIITEPDYDPQRDWQAISRTHQLGQNKEVRVFYLMTRSSVEERIMEYLRLNKLDLDQITDSMDPEDKHDAGSLGGEYLKFALKPIFEEEAIEDPRPSDIGFVQKTIQAAFEAHNPDDTFDRIVSPKIWTGREWGEFSSHSAARGDYGRISDAIWSPIIQQRVRDIIFERELRNFPPMTLDSDHDSDDDSIDLPVNSAGERLSIPVAPPGTPVINCILCKAEHALGYCPLKFIQVEACQLCRTAHFAGMNNCPAFKNPNNIKAMIMTLRESPEEPKVVQEVVAMLEKRKIELLAKGGWWVDGRGGWIEKEKVMMYGSRVRS